MPRDISLPKRNPHTPRARSHSQRGAVTQTTDPVSIIAALDLIPLRPTAAGGPLVVRNPRAEMRASTHLPSISGNVECSRNRRPGRSMVQWSLLAWNLSVSRHTYRGCQGASEPQSARPPSSPLPTASATHCQPLCCSILPYPDTHARYGHSATMSVPSLPPGLGDTVRAGVCGRHDDVTASVRPRGPQRSIRSLDSPLPIPGLHVLPGADARIR